MPVGKVPPQLEAIDQSPDDACQVRFAPQASGIPRVAAVNRKPTDTQRAGLFIFHLFRHARSFRGKSLDESSPQLQHIMPIRFNCLVWVRQYRKNEEHVAIYAIYERQLSRELPQSKMFLKIILQGVYYP